MQSDLKAQEIFLPLLVQQLCYKWFVNVASVYSFMQYLREYAKGKNSRMEGGPIGTSCIAFTAKQALLEHYTATVVLVIFC